MHSIKWSKSISTSNFDYWTLDYKLQLTSARNDMNVLPRLFSMSSAGLIEKERKKMIPLYVLSTIVANESRDKLLKSDDSSQTCFTIIFFFALFFKNGPSLASFSFIYVFSNNHCNLTTNTCEKCPSSIRCWDSNPWL